VPSQSVVAIERPPSFLDREVNLAAEHLPVAFIVEQLAARGLLTLLSAQTTAGKTQLALQLGDAVGSGGGVVCGLQCDGGKVLYLDAENGPQIIQGRQHTAALNPGAIRYLGMAGARLDRAGDHAMLAETIRQADADLVVIDSLRRLSGSAKEDSADDMAPLVGGLANVARETDAAILLIHHRSTKGGAAVARGSSAIEDQADIIYTLDKGRGQLRKLACRKLRVAAEPSPVDLRLSTTPLRLVLAGDGSLVAQLDGLDVGPGWSFAKIGQALGLDTKAQAGKKALQRALTAGQWVNIEHGIWAPTDVPLPVA
jgi:hypothetical protein